MSAIEWTDVTWNPVRGCSRVSAGCKNCYAERIAVRFSGPGKPYAGFADVPAGRRHSETGAATVGVRGHWTGRVELIPSKLDEPLRWRKPRRVFVNSMSDLFHEALPAADIGSVFRMMALAPQHTFQVLTKRPARMREFLLNRSAKHSGAIHPNVWLGVSCEDQKTADERIPLLLQTPAAVRFVSLEPLLGPITLRTLISANPVYRVDALAPHPSGLPRRWLDWVIVGGESGPGARPLQLGWVRSIRDQCREAGVAFFYKQGGHGHRCVHSAKGGHFECIPADLRVREFPA